MASKNQTFYFIGYIALFVIIPIFLYLSGNFPERSLLKQFISLLVLIPFFLLLAQFFLIRSSKRIMKELKAASILKIHKNIGYFVITILLIHPFLIVVPRYFEAGVEPVEAFLTIITTFNSTGIINGMIAWCLVFVLGITSFLRNRIGLTYKTWRIFHGILSIVFIILACWHAIDLGRHTDFTISMFIIITALSGIHILLKVYLIDFKKHRGGK